jgi:hypothetical protein
MIMRSTDVDNIYLEYSSQVQPGNAPILPEPSSSYLTTQSMNGPGNGPHTLSDHNSVIDGNEGTMIPGLRKKDNTLIKKKELIKVINKLINASEARKMKYATDVLVQLKNAIKHLSA